MSSFRQLLAITPFDVPQAAQGFLFLFFKTSVQTLFLWTASSRFLVLTTLNAKKEYIDVRVK
jgi:hypothetical protein